MSNSTLYKLEQYCLDLNIAKVYDCYKPKVEYAILEGDLEILDTIEVFIHIVVRDRVDFSLEIATIFISRDNWLVSMSFATHK